MSKLISKIVVPDSSEATGYSLYNVKDSGAIHSSDVGVAGGVASLDNAGKVPSSLLPSYVDDVIEGYYHENKFYTTYTPGQEEEDPGTYSGEITAETGKIYVDIPTNQSYRWSGSAYIVISSPYVLPTASANTLGGVKVGDNLSIDQNGVLSAQASSGAKTNEENGIGIGTCSTSSGTALAVTLSGYELVQNGIVAVTFEHDVPANATLNINGKGAKPIIYKGSAITADTIKADDTVMFAYDGTNYVVTSLGAGEGGGATQEFAVISLKTYNNNDSALIGTTIVITNDDTSETILSTTWSGTDVIVGIDGGVEYTITVGSITYYTTPSTESYIAIAGLTRDVSFLYLYATVADLGLPSGTKWAVGNIVSDGNDGYRIGYETDYGAYVSWGNIVPHFSANGSTFDDGYDWGNSNSGPYASTSGATISGSETTGASYAANSGYDAARELLGGKWRMPTTAEFQELNEYCTSVWTTKNGVNGREFTSNINGAKIFLPAAGIGKNTSLQNYGSDGFYASSSLRVSGDAYGMRFGSNSVNALDTPARYNGLSVRAVQ